ncbi:GNAT family N-acetyltransferase [Caproiciproducens sp. MSJ-32]|uniref:GNAT family N-acetyltransferase n=1 Tax=Caproiciproducens sp. MSJ-32 TaxID=2841527 RepID=UPI0016B59199|nr:GNAT family N-acetyltransferase [Caproiciproducens sp. MSJ-32]MBU5454866.1 GNAT family N-acetyltransferase [Caproiciproducens sp. MSJ-32]NLL30749.1 GNAT family N-acetyltransferase [Clostridiales bacterium]
MKLRKSKEKDIKDIMKIIKEAQDYFKEMKIDQWQNGYPNEDAIRKDILNGYSYVLTDNDKVIATVALSFDGEATYNEIYEGSWLTDNEYAVIHRIAVTEEMKGKNIASIILKRIEEICKERAIKSIKIDTHEDNLSMQRLLKKNNFKYCGVIYLEGKVKRIAFEKEIN